MKIDVPHTAKLANLPLKPQETQKFAKQMEETIEYVDRLSEIDTKNILPTAHVTGLENVMREDIAKESLTQKEALANTRMTHQGNIQVAHILENN